jgi:peptide/nickel transport system substrate-binding protein
LNPQRAIVRIFQAAAAVFVLASPLSAQRATPRQGGTLVIAGASDLQMVNSLVNADGPTREFINHVLFLPLVKLDSALNVSPALAQSWQNAGDSVVVFRLRRDVRWHDGRPTTAHDVAFTFQRAQDSLTAFPDAEAIANWKTIEVVDSYTVRLRGTPRRDALLGLVPLAIMPKHLLDSVPAARLRQAAFNKNPVGNGPFRFVSQRPNDRWSFEANTTFPRELGGRPYVDRLVYRVIPENVAQMTELRTGQIDVANGIRADQIKELDALPDLRAARRPTLKYAMITWNNKRGALANPNVRRALTIGMNRQRMIELLRAGYAQVAVSPVPPTHWAFDPSISPLPYDTSAARRLLRQAGYIDRNRDGVLESADGKPLEVELEIAANNAFNRDIGEMVRSDLARVGVRIIPRAVDFATMIQHISGPEKNFDGAFLQFETELQLNLNDAFHSSALGGPFQSASYSNAKLDVLLDQANSARTRAAARPIWSQIQRMLRDDQPWTFLWYNPELYVFRERVRGVRLDLRGAFAELPRWWLAN